MNTFKTVILMSSMMVLLLIVGASLGGEQGMILAFVISLALNFGSYWFSDKIVLRLYRATPATESSHPGYYASVARLAAQAGLPMPNVYVLPSEAMNAFATGRNPEHAAVAVTEGLLRTPRSGRTRRVIAHEPPTCRTGTSDRHHRGDACRDHHLCRRRMAGWAAIRRGQDRRTQTVSLDLAMLIIAPLAAPHSDGDIAPREFAADAGAARITGRPLSLANALRKLAQSPDRQIGMTANPSTAHLFIVNPLRGGGIMKLFSTHPPMEERIERLDLIARGGA